MERGEVVSEAAKWVKWLWLLSNDYFNMCHHLSHKAFLLSLINILPLFLMCIVSAFFTQVSGNLVQLIYLMVVWIYNDLSVNEKSADLYVCTNTKYPLEGRLTKKDTIVVQVRTGEVTKWAQNHRRTEHFLVEGHGVNSHDKQDMSCQENA